MIIPIRCFTCAKVLANVWEDFAAILDPTPEKLSAFLDSIGFRRICCRRHMLSHVDLIEQI
jgi:DNA-directed RNA polymerase I, II, and III subunit RPABC5